MTEEFILIGDHPHKGERCKPKGETEETISTINMFGQDMYLMELINCEHGIKECYAKKNQLKLSEIASSQAPRNDIK